MPITSLEHAAGGDSGRRSGRTSDPQWPHDHRDLVTVHSVICMSSRRRRTRARALLCALCALLPSSALATDDSERIVVLTTSRGLYRVAAEATVARLQTAGANCELLVVSTQDAQARQETLERLRESASTLVVTGGATLTREALKTVPKAPVVFVMVPNALDASFLREGSPYVDRVAGVTSDVAPARQVDWIRRTHPKCQRVAVLCSARSVRTAAALEAAGRERGIEVTPLSAKRDEFPAAVDALNAGKFDGVVMIPDSQVYNSPNVQRLLLWGLRQKRPVWAFSDKVVKAGALAGVYSDPTEVGSQAAEIVQEILRGKDPQSIGLRYPHGLGHAVNLHTAGMISVRFGDDLFATTVKRFGEP